MKKMFLWVFILLLAGCGDSGKVEIATFSSVDIANKVVVLLSHYKIPAKLIVQKEKYTVAVDQKSESESRIILTKFNLYFQDEDISELLDSKFASLSKLETVKSNLIESLVIYNKISVVPNILRVNVVVTGDETKNVSLLIMTLSDMGVEDKKSIDTFLRGVINENDKLTISYFVQNIPQ